MTPPTERWALWHQLTLNWENALQGLSLGQAGGGMFSVQVPSSQISWVCIKLTNRAKPTRTVWHGSLRVLKSQREFLLGRHPENQILREAGHSCVWYGLTSPSIAVTSPYRLQKSQAAQIHRAPLHRRSVSLNVELYFEGFRICAGARLSIADSTSSLSNSLTAFGYRLGPTVPRNVMWIVDAEDVVVEKKLRSISLNCSIMLPFRGCYKIIACMSDKCSFKNIDMWHINI